MSESSCPKCSSKNVAEIFWGMPNMTSEFEQALGSGKVTLGGCCVSDNDPKWECNKCGHRWE